MQVHRVEPSGPLDPGPQAEERSPPGPDAQEESLPGPDRTVREPAAGRTSSGRWWRSRWIWIPAALVALYGLLGFLVVPRVLRSQLEKRLPPLLHREVTVREVLFNPFALSLTLRGVHITDAQFIQKPFTIDELSSKVRDVLAKV